MKRTPSGRATDRHEHAVIHPEPGGGRDDLRRNPGQGAAAPCLPLPGGEPDASAADRLVARLFGARGVHPRLQKVDRNHAVAREKAPSAASIKPHEAVRWSTGSRVVSTMGARARASESAPKPVTGAANRQFHRSTCGQRGDFGTTLMPMLRMRESTQWATS